MPVRPLPWHAAAWKQVMERKPALPHALLITGRAGTGKLDFARNLACSLLCEAPAADGAACGTCAGCRWFVAGSHPDYREIQPEVLRAARDEEGDGGERKASHQISVDDVRALADFITLSSHRAGDKVIVLSPAETLNVSAANALLKSLEEPPPRTYFLLVAHRPHYLLPTIVSRCQRIVLPVPDAQAASSWLREQGIAEAELSLAQTGNAPLAAANLCDGDFWQQRQALLELIAADHIDALQAAESCKDFPVERVLGWLQRWTYDLMLVRATGQVRYNPDFRNSLETTGARFGPIALARFHRQLLHWQRHVHHPLNPRLFIEHMLLSYAQLARGAVVAPEFQS